MKRLNVLLCGVLFVYASASDAGNFQAGIGLFALAKNGADVALSYRQPESHYQFGMKYTHWTDVAHDPFTGRVLDETHQTLTGPIVNYLFHPEASSSGYIGVSILQWTHTISPRQIVTPDHTVRTVDPYFGGGYSGQLGRTFYYNAGFYLSPTAKIDNQTPVSSETQGGNFDIQLQIGLTF